MVTIVVSEWLNQVTVIMLLLSIIGLGIAIRRGMGVFLGVLLSISLVWFYFYASYAEYIASIAGAMV
jgi:hypothetical protein